MAKQTFTTGDVLTAAAMTSLQQTAMGGGSTTAKTASYTLVAADAGTVVQMNSASATTITVDTGLFAAGDTVQIQNIGAGVCTVTAGTATVNTAGSLALSQYENGTLYFTATGASLFFDTFQSSGGGGGKVLQVVSAITSTATTIATTAMTDTTITATISPTVATSKVLVLINGFVRHSINSSGTLIGGQVMRGATAIQGYGSASLSGFGATGATATEAFDRVQIMYMDSPATTSSTIYKLQARINDTANSGTSTWQSGSIASSIVLMEIGV